MAWSDGCAFNCYHIRTLNRDETTTRSFDEAQALHEISAGTASEVGEKFFQSLVEHLAQAMNVSMAFVGEFTDVPGRVRTLAFWSGGKQLGPIEYELAGTPCEEVYDGEPCHYADSVKEAFPQDPTLEKLGIRSYLGVPFADCEGRVIGHLAVADVKPMPDEPIGMSIFKIFAARASSELRRTRAEMELGESETRLSGVLHSAMDAIVLLDNDLVVRIFNPAAERIFRCPAADVLGTSFERFLSPAFNRSAIQESFANNEGRDALWAPEGLTALRDDGEEFAVEATISPVSLGAETCYTLIVRDVNDRKCAEAEFERLRSENRYLHEKLEATQAFDKIIGESVSIRQLFKQVEQVASTEATVLITGETGTGKELFAQAIHDRSPRKEGPLIKLNCAALPAGLVESELFGHEKGAFTGALERRIGRFELASGGTLFLDEIGEIEPEVQVRLLRVLQEREFERVGSGKTIETDVRVIVATNRDLLAEVKAGRFREDLYYRLNVFPISIPPLRTRGGDLELLVSFFLEKFTKRLGRRVTGISARALSALRAYPWPGNIRELENVLERAAILSDGTMLDFDGSFLRGTSSSADSPDFSETLDALQKKHIESVLERTAWRVEGEGGAAGILGLHPNTLRSRMKKLDISR